jgi:hypothetical protein
MSNFVALYDACVLHPAPLRDLLMHLAIAGLYRAKWTQRIEQEWMRSVMERRPDLPAEWLERTRDRMNAHLPDAMVRGYESLEAGLELPDPNDRHVLAAAIHCHAGAIVTCNLKDFPVEALAPHGIGAQHPDEFIEHAFGIDPAAVIRAVRNQRAALRYPAKSIEELFDTYLKQGLATTVALLQPHADLL